MRGCAQLQMKVVRYELQSIVCVKFASVGILLDSTEHAEKAIQEVRVILEVQRCWSTAEECLLVKISLGGSSLLIHLIRPSCARRTMRNPTLYKAAADKSRRQYYPSILSLSPSAGTMEEEVKLTIGDVQYLLIENEEV